MFDQEEQERIDDLKVWWKQYGNMVLLGVTAFLMAIAGMQGWRYYQHSQRTQAAALYDALENAAQGNDVKKIRDAATAIIDQYPATGYAVSAALLSARVNFETGDVKSAKAQLQWVIEHASEGPSKQIARLRLAGRPRARGPRRGPPTTRPLPRLIRKTSLTATMCRSSSTPWVTPSEGRAGSARGLDARGGSVADGTQRLFQRAFLAYLQGQRGKASGPGRF
jgi:hypothetical protein